jgi:hypothetical protein
MDMGMEYLWPLGNDSTTNTNYQIVLVVPSCRIWYNNSFAIYPNPSKDILRFQSQEQ